MKERLMSREPNLNCKIVDIKSTLHCKNVFELLAPSVYNPTRERLLNRAKRYQESNKTRVYAYTQNGEYKAIVIFEIHNKTATILDIAVKSESRGKGIGSKLIDFIFSQFEISEITAVTDDEAVDFYKKYGFTVVDIEIKFNTRRYICVCRKENNCYCGHNCSKCITYLATKNNDDKLREKSGAFYKEYFGRDIPLEAFNCYGGKSDSVFFLCNECPFRKCCREQGIDFCFECQNYPCDAIKDYQEKYVNKCN